MPILLIDGRDCAKLRHLYKYLKHQQNVQATHIHVRLAIDEVPNIRHLVNHDIHTLLLQPIAYNWSPYAVLRDVNWLAEFHALQHLEISLNGDSAPKFVELLKCQLTFPKLQALVVSTNHACHGLWHALTTWNRPCLRVLCTNGFRLENVPFHNLQSLRYLYINRPGTRHSSYLATNIARDLPVLKYLTTSEFPGLGTEITHWMTCLSTENSLPELQFWEVNGSDLTKHDIVFMTTSLIDRKSPHPLTIQGLVMNETCVSHGFHRLLSYLARIIPLHKHRIYRSLDVLENVLHTRIPTPSGSHIILKGKHVV